MLIDSSSGGGRVSGIYASKRYEWDLSLQYTLQHYLWGGKMVLDVKGLDEDKLLLVAGG